MNQTHEVVWKKRKQSRTVVLPKLDSSRQENRTATEGACKQWVLRNGRHSCTSKAREGNLLSSFQFTGYNPPTWSVKKNESEKSSMILTTAP